jgi:hypothetical protein
VEESVLGLDDAFCAAKVEFVRCIFPMKESHRVLELEKLSGRENTGTWRYIALYVFYGCGNDACRRPQSSSIHLNHSIRTMADLGTALWVLGEVSNHLLVLSLYSAI